MPVNPDIIFILLYFQKKVYRQSGAGAFQSASLFCCLQNYISFLLYIAFCIVRTKGGQKSSADRKAQQKGGKEYGSGDSAGRRTCGGI